MPQQICTLCCDKINDFYEFREMCAATNEQTRKLLRLPEITKTTPVIEKVVSMTAADDDDEGVESIFGVMGGDEPEEKFNTKSVAGMGKKGKKATATTSKKSARNSGKVKKEITTFAEYDDGSDPAKSIIISDDEPEWVPKKRARNKKSDDDRNAALLLAPKELNERERQREMEQRKNESGLKKKNK